MYTFSIKGQIVNVYKFSGTLFNLFFVLNICPYKPYCVYRLTPDHMQCFLVICKWLLLFHQKGWAFIMWSWSWDRPHIDKTFTTATMSNSRHKLFCHTKVELGSLRAVFPIYIFEWKRSYIQSLKSLERKRWK